MNAIHLIAGALVTTSLFFAPSALKLEHEAKAQSFSCAQAQLPSELAVCNNEKLLIKDEQVAELFANAVVKASAENELDLISTDHSNWLNERNACRVDFDCLEKKYDERIRYLNSQNL